eukprot:TRINITY_DN8712_c0_g3_i10.p2 TRINITY_DN8712_c0_g3~~TRINITY_DN8712_c0_g3_i10.p2  ORF type:complete len:123 (+),score=7.50 TRINITY_DN8712_c0_g3_i10:41-370(+)
MSTICMQCQAHITKPKQQKLTLLNPSNSKIQKSQSELIFGKQIGRRQIVQIAPLMVLIFGEQFNAEAGVLQDLGRQYIRAGEEVDSVDAVQQLIKAEKTLQNLKSGEIF